MRKIKILLGALLLLCSMTVFGQGRTLNQLTVTGTLTGESLVEDDTDATITLTLTQCRNGVRLNNDADVIHYDLPNVEVGLVVMIYDFKGGVITIDPNLTDHIFLNGVDVGAGDTIESGGNIGELITLIGISDTEWLAIDKPGEWADSNP